MWGHSRVPGMGSRIRPSPRMSKQARGGDLASLGRRACRGTLSGSCYNIPYKGTQPRYWGKEVSEPPRPGPDSSLEDSGPGRTRLPLKPPTRTRAHGRNRGGPGRKQGAPSAPVSPSPAPAAPLPPAWPPRGAAAPLHGPVTPSIPPSRKAALPRAARPPPTAQLLPRASPPRHGFRRRSGAVTQAHAKRDLQEAGRPRAPPTLQPHSLTWLPWQPAQPALKAAAY